jgi:hypothetical protein
MAMIVNSSRTKKTLLKVAVMLDAGEGEQFVYMFVPPTLEVGDVLNDDRSFLPFEHIDGTVAQIAKKCIRSVVPMNSGQRIDTNDPHDVIGVDPSVSDAELQTAYHKAISAVHPDRLTPLGLPAELMEMATRRAAKLNDAYRKIKFLRKFEMEPAEDPSAG